jgi:predicted NBD/HSP70 family sugar kinase
MARLVARVADDAARVGAGVAGIGVSTGGRVDAERGVVLESSALIEGWNDVPLAARLRERTGLSIRIDNDGHCAAIAERHFGHGRDVRSFVTVVVGTGIGGGVVLDGQLWRGARNAAGELGHLMVDVEGRPCACGGRGCVEAYASGSGLAERARELAAAGVLDLAGTSPLDAQALGRMASQGDAAARDLVAAGGRALGVALASLLNVFNPERIVLGGPVLRLGDAYLAPLRDTVARRTLSTQRDAADIVVSELEDAPLLGAAALVLFP